METGKKSYMVALWLSIFLGLFGADRYYLGYKNMGWLKLLSLGGLGLWWLLDLTMLYRGKIRAADGSEWHHA